MKKQLEKLMNNYNEKNENKFFTDKCINPSAETEKYNYFILFFHTYKIYQKFKTQKEAIKYLEKYQ